MGWNYYTVIMYDLQQREANCGHGAHGSGKKDRPKAALNA